MEVAISDRFDKMFGGDDFFNEIEKAFFSQGARPRTSSHGDVVRREKEERTIDYIEDNDFVYFVFELPGYFSEDVKVDVSKEEVEVSAIKKDVSSVQDYLSRKLSKGLYYKKIIPVKVKSKKYEKTFRNGVLEIKIPRR